MIKCIAGIAALSCLATGASAQVIEPPGRVGDTKVLVVNALLGGITAGTWRIATKRPVWGGFARGVAAGTAVYAGKRIIASGQPAGWWAGRQIAALGSSEIVNASKALPVLQTAVIPIGPLRIHVDRAKHTISPRLDLLASAATVAIASKGGSRFAWKETLATGLPVFVRPETSNEVGNYAAGVLRVSDLLPNADFPPLETKRTVLSHEMVHAAQYDFFFTAWSDPVQSAIARRFGVVDRISRYVDVNLLLPVELGANATLKYKNRPWESEALSLSKRAP